MPEDLPPSPSPRPRGPARSAPPQALARWQAPLALPRWGVWLLALVAALAFVVAVGQWRRLNHIQEKLAAQSGTMQEQAIEARTLSQEALALARDSAAKASLGEARINEYTLQRSRIEQLAFELSRSRDETMLNDIEASLRLAQQQAQLTGLADPLVAALRNASQRVDRADQPRLSPIQRAIERDLQRLTSMEVTDTAGLLGRIDQLLAQLQLLPLANAVPQQTAAQPSPPSQNAPRPAAPSNPQPPTSLTLATDAADRQPAAANPADAEAAPPAPEAPPEPAPETDSTQAAAAPTTAELTAAHMQPRASTRTAPAAQEDAPAPQGFWAGLRGGLGDLVRVQRIDAPEAALLSPEQAFFLRENIRLQLMNARMGLLARQNESARADLAAVQTLIQTYYDTESPRTRQALRTLKLLHDHIQSVQPPAITETLVAIQAAHVPVVGPAGAASAATPRPAPGAAATKGAP